MRTRVPKMGAWVSRTGVQWCTWAPGHQKIEVVLYAPDGVQELQRHEGRPEPGGYFSVQVRGVGAGTLYKLVVDGQGPFPDPFSRSQPLGVHGPSQVTEEHFRWTDTAWRGISLEDVVIYEVHVGTATPEGTFDALAERLPEIQTLGATAIELMPVASFPGHHNWGYDGVFLNAPHAGYGGPEGMKRFVNAAHGAGLAVIQDVVYNHFGPDGNYLSVFSPHYFTNKRKTPWGDAINFDGESSAPVRELFAANAEMWIREYHLDGLRLDATHAMEDHGPVHILAEVANRARAAGQGRNVLIMAEDDRNDTMMVAAPADHGMGLDGVWADDFHHQWRRALTGDKEGYFADYSGTPDDVVQTFNQGWFYQGQYSEHLKRHRGTPGNGMDPVRFIHCLQNHDQVGNRALGDRLGHDVSASAYRAASAALLLSPYTPLIFMGQEWNASTPFRYFTDHNEELGRLVTEGRRREFSGFSSFQGVTVPDPQARETFEVSKLNWEERARAPHAGVLAWYHALLHLRATHTCCRRRGRSDFTAGLMGPRTIFLERRASESRMLVLINLAGSFTRTLGQPGEWHIIAFSEDERFGGQTRPSDAFMEGHLTLEGPAAMVLESET